MLYHRHVSFRCCSVLLPILCCTPRHRFFFFFKQKTAYEMRISDWSSDVCSSDLTYRIVPAVCGATANRWALACWLRSGTGKRSAAPGSGPRARKTSAAGRRRRIGAGVGGSAAKGKARRHRLQDEPRATEAERGPTATLSTGTSRITQKHGITTTTPTPTKN